MAALELIADNALIMIIISGFSQTYAVGELRDDDSPEQHRQS